MNRMKCAQCGYYNDKEVDKCVKCGITINGENLMEDTGKPGRSDRHTKVGVQSGKTAWDPWNRSEPSRSRPTQALKCASCGYTPLMSYPTPGTPCPNCEYKGEEEPYHDQKKEHSQPDSEQKPFTGNKQAQRNPAKGKTIGIADLNRRKSQTHSIVLKQVGSDDEKEFAGKKIMITRESLDPSDSALSSKEHAQFVFDGSRLLLEDKSSNNLTFVYVNEKQEVKKGTFVMLGNKIYEVVNISIPEELE